MSVLDRLDRKRLRRLINESAPAARAVVLIGSFARGKAVRPMSDIDVLVISDDSPGPDSETHLVVIPPTRFRDRVLAGDDFAQWALRYGIPLSGRAWWSATQKELHEAPWPNAAVKFELAEKRLAIVDDLLAMGDIDAAQSELRSALSLVARGVLLEAEVFPLSRPELPGQLESIGYGELATSLREVGSERSMQARELSEAAAQGRWPLEAQRGVVDNGTPRAKTRAAP